LGYHYVTENDPASQAQTWLDAGGGSVCMFDWEANSGNLANYFAVAAAFNAAGVTVFVGYCPWWYWSEVGEGDLSSIPTLISSAYPVGSEGGAASTLYADCGGDEGEGWDAYGDADPTIWQFTDNASVGSFSGIDCNAYKGTDLAAAFGLSAAPTPEEDGFLSALSDAQQIDLYNLVVLSAQQLLGVLEPPVPLLSGGAITEFGTGWAQQGQNAQGQNLTTVDALSVTSNNKNSIGAAVADIQKAVGTPNPDSSGVLNQVLSGGGSGLLGLLSGLLQSLPVIQNAIDEAQKGLTGDQKKKKP
jgi:hypothetical protein